MQRQPNEIQTAVKWSSGRAGNVRAFGVRSVRLVRSHQVPLTSTDAGVYSDREGRDTLRRAKLWIPALSLT